MARQRQVVTIPKFIGVATVVRKPPNAGGHLVDFIKIQRQHENMMAERVSFWFQSVMAHHAFIERGTQGARRGHAASAVNARRLHDGGGRFGYVHISSPVSARTHSSALVKPSS